MCNFVVKLSVVVILTCFASFYALKAIPVLPSLLRNINQHVQESYIEFLDDTSCWGSTDKDGSWLKLARLEDITLQLQHLQLNQSCDLMGFLYGCPSPLAVPIHSEDAYEMTLLHLPPNAAFPPRYHTGGSVVIYKRLYGRGNCRRIIVNREIGKEELPEKAVQVRLGGIHRILESSNSSRLCVLETVLYPPRRVQEGLSSGGFEEDEGEDSSSSNGGGSSHVLKLHIPSDQPSHMSLSHLFGAYNELIVTSSSYTRILYE